MLLHDIRYVPDGPHIQLVPHDSGWKVHILRGQHGPTAYCTWVYRLRPALDSANKWSKALGLKVYASPELIVLRRLRGERNEHHPDSAEDHR